MNDAKETAIATLKREATIHFRHKKGHLGGHDSVKFADALKVCFALGVEVSETEAIIDEVFKEEE